MPSSTFKKCPLEYITPSDVWTANPWPITDDALETWAPAAVTVVILVDRAASE